MSVANKLNIIFYFPYKGTGGVSVLFLKTAKELSTNYNVFLVDFKDGYMGTRVPMNVNFIDIDTVKVYPINSIVILQSLPFWRINDFDKFSPETKFLFWNLHPKNFEYKLLDKGKSLLSKFLSLFLKFYKSKFQKCLIYFTETDSLFFMDYENYRSTKSFYPNINIKEKYLPCFTDEVSNKIYNTQAEPCILNFCWIGRIVDFKVHILIHTLERLNTITNLSFDFTIIGDGDKLEFIKAHFDKRNLNYKITFINEIPIEDVGEYLNNNCDLLFAMGLSALEGASRHIPTMLLDYSYFPINGSYKFKYLFEQEKYNLTSEINKESFDAFSSLETKLNNFKEDKYSIGQLCYDYWLNNHSSNIAIEKLETAIINSRSNKKDIEKLQLNRPDIFSILYYDIITYIYSLFRKNGHIIQLHGFRYPKSNI